MYYLILEYPDGRRQVLKKYSMALGYHRSKSPIPLDLSFLLISLLLFLLSLLFWELDIFSSAPHAYIVLPDQYKQISKIKRSCGSGIPQIRFVQNVTSQISHFTFFITEEKRKNYLN